jgi:dUTP pyrophosphatase
MKFSKVAFSTYVEDRGYNVPECTQAELEMLWNEYEDIKLPKRGTSGSAGYDLFAPVDIEIKKGEYVVFSTGITFDTDRDDVFFMCVPRSGLGFKYQTSLANTIGVIDSDYCKSDNQGHIKVKITANYDILIEKGKAFAQGIIVPFLKVDDDNVETERNGGFGSTDKK